MIAVSPFSGIERRGFVNLWVAAFVGVAMKADIQLQTQIAVVVAWEWQRRIRNRERLRIASNPFTAATADMKGELGRETDADIV